jgi:hypothetical protein
MRTSHREMWAYVLVLMLMLVWVLMLVLMLVGKLVLMGKLVLVLLVSVTVGTRVGVPMAVSMGMWAHS